MDERDENNKPHAPEPDPDEKLREEAKRVQRHIIPCFDDAETSVEKMLPPDHPLYSSTTTRIIKDPEDVMEPESNKSRTLAIFVAIVATILLIAAITHNIGRPLSGDKDTPRVAEPPAPGAQAIQDAKETEKRREKAKKEWAEIKYRNEEKANNIEARKAQGPTWEASKYLESVFKMTPSIYAHNVLATQISYPGCPSIDQHSFYYPKTESVKSRFMLYKVPSAVIDECVKKLSGTFTVAFEIPVLVSTTFREKLSCYENGGNSICCDGMASNECKEKDGYRVTGYEEARTVYDATYLLHGRINDVGDSPEIEYIDFEYKSEIPESTVKQIYSFKKRENEYNDQLSRGAFGDLSRVPDCKNKDADNDQLQFAYEVTYIPGEGAPVIELTQVTAQFDPATIQMTKRILLDSFNAKGSVAGMDTTYRAFIVCRCGSDPGCELRKK